MYNAIEVSNLTKYYGKLLAVDHVSFEIKSGEVFGFLGPNGAGKTTTLRMLTGLTKPTSGTAAVAGFDILRESTTAKEHIGLVPEVSNLYVLDVLALGLFSFVLLVIAAKVLQKRLE